MKQQYQPQEQSLVENSPISPTTTAKATPPIQTLLDPETTTQQPRQRQAWLEKLRRLARIQHWIARFAGSPIAYLVSAFLLIGAFAASVAVAPWLVFSPWSNWLWAIIIVGLCVLIPSIASGWKRNMERRLESEGVQTIGAIVERLQIPDEHEFTQRTLLSLLPRLSAGDTSLLDERQRRILNNHLDNLYRAAKRYPHAPASDDPSWYDFRRPEDIQLAIAILRAYKRVGDRHSIPSVELFTTADDIGPGYGLVRKTAKECLRRLQARADHEQDAQTLLRASVADAQSDTLLRPAQGVTDTDTQQLLRPGNPDAEP